MLHIIRCYRDFYRFFIIDYGDMRVIYNSIFKQLMLPEEHRRSSYGSGGS